MKKTRLSKKTLRSVSATAVAGLVVLAIPLTTTPVAGALTIPPGYYIPDKLVYESVYQPVDYRSQQGGDIETTNAVPAGNPADVIRTGFGPPGTIYRANPDNEVRLDVGLFTGDVYIPREARNNLGQNRLGIDITYPDGTEETSWFTVDVPETTASQSRIFIQDHLGASLIDERVVSQVHMRVGHEEVLQVRNINPQEGLDGLFDEGASLWMTDEYGNGEEVTEWAHLKQYGESGQRSYEMRLLPSDNEVGWNRIPLTARYADGSWRTIAIDVFVSDDAHLDAQRSIPEVQVEAWGSLRVPMRGAPLPEGTIYRGVDSNPRWAKVNRFTGEVHYEPKSKGIQLRPYDIGVSAKLPDGSMMTFNTKVNIMSYNKGNSTTDVSTLGASGRALPLQSFNAARGQSVEIPIPDYPEAPNVVDVDGDGVPDDVEKLLETDPNDRDSQPSKEDLAQFAPDRGDSSVYYGDPENPEWMEVDPVTGSVGIRQGYEGESSPEPGEYSYRVVKSAPAPEGEVGTPHAGGEVHEGVLTIDNDRSIVVDAGDGGHVNSTAGTDEERASFSRNVASGSDGVVRIADPNAETYSLEAGTTLTGKVNALPEWISVDKDTGAVHYDVPDDAEAKTYAVVVKANGEDEKVSSETVAVLSVDGGDSAQMGKALTDDKDPEESESKGWFRKMIDALFGR